VPFELYQFGGASDYTQDDHYKVIWAWEYVGRAKKLAEGPAARSMKHLDRILVVMMDGIDLQVTCIAGPWIKKSPRL
jgi:hypothetical protein